MEIGAQIKNRYTVVEHVGRGGMADVWSARDERLGRMVAVKTIATGLTQEANSVSLFEQEAQTIAKIEHENILPIYDFGEYKGSLFIVMRYMTGGSLEDVLRQGAMPPQEALKMGEKVGRALDFAHANKIIHLDLKPPNILLDSQENPFLADFGLATVLDTDGHARNPGGGTLLYMAPEQLTEDMIGHEADVYSFCIMLFHMLTGTLPFEGRTPLALMQLQEGRLLPALHEMNESIPQEVTSILQAGTAVEPDERPTTHMDIIDQLYTAFQRSTHAFSRATQEVPGYFLETQALPRTADSALREAVDLYSRARYDWQGGQGRFLLGVTHFMLMNGYYRHADEYGLQMDAAGYQMLLRGALEYDHDLEYWWAQVGDEDRRWVCLHALRSGNAPARLRALYRLETLPDQAGAPVIPRLVAQALEREADTQTKIAALTVLGTRAQLMKRARVDIPEEYQGRLLSTMTRLGIQIREPALWQETVYGEDVDRLIAEQAFDDAPEVAAFAARTVGKMRSLAGLRVIAEAQRQQRPGALQALAYVRDEAPSLPNVVTRQGRFYAWIANTARRLSDRPLDLIMRFVLALLGGWVGMGEYVYSTFRSQQLFTPQRWANTIAVGLVFGLFMGVTVLAADEFSRRLRGFWPWWLRLAVFGALGYLLGSLSFAGFTWLFYQYNPVWDLMRFVGFAFAFTLVMSGLLELRPWQSVLLVTSISFVAIFTGHQAYYAFQETTIVPLAAVALLAGTLVGHRARQLAPSAEVEARGRGAWLPMLLAAGLAVGWALLMWGYFDLAAGSEPPITWDAVRWMLLGVLVFAALVAYFLRTGSRLLFGVLGLAAFAGLYALLGWQFFDFSFSLPSINDTPPLVIDHYQGDPLLPVRNQPVLHYDDVTQAWTIGLPMLLVIALGANLRGLLNGWWAWVGAPSTTKERGGWLSGALLYALIVTGTASVLALFSMKESVPWALLWSAWAFVSFVLSLAAYRWARWGAVGLMASALLFILGGFFYDAVTILEALNAGDVPVLLSRLPITLSIFGAEVLLVLDVLTFWAIWGLVLGIFVWGAQRRTLWGGIGLVALLVGWYIVAMTSPVQGSVALLAMTQAALLAYALQPNMDAMEAGRIPGVVRRTESAPAAPADAPALPTEPSVALPTEAVVPASEHVRTLTPSQLQQQLEQDYDPAANLQTQMLDTGSSAYTGDKTVPISVGDSEFQRKPPAQDDADTPPSIRIDTEPLRRKESTDEDDEETSAPDDEDDA